MDGIDFDWEGLRQSVDNNGWSRGVKKVIEEKVEEFREFYEDLKKLVSGLEDEEEFIAKWGNKVDIVFIGGDKE